MLIFYLVFRLTVPINYTMSVIRSCSTFQFLTSPPNLKVHSQLSEQISMFFMLEMCHHLNRRIQCETFQCLGEMVLRQLPISKHCSFLQTYAWCHCRKILKTLTSIITFAAFCWLLSCRASRRRPDNLSSVMVLFYVR